MRIARPEDGDGHPDNEADTILAVSQIEDGDGVALEATGRSVASVQFMITSAMREILTNELQFLDSEVDEMKPELAAKMIETGTKRPFGDGREMPESWKRGAMPERKRDVLGFFRNINSLQVIVLGAIGVLAGLVVTNKIELETLLGGASTALPKEKLSSHVKKKKKKKKKGKKRTIPKRTNVVEN